jgi:hypothetical protein
MKNYSHQSGVATLSPQNDAEVAQFNPAAIKEFTPSQAFDATHTVST